jgi:hypothetical protein
VNNFIVYGSSLTSDAQTKYIVGNGVLKIFSTIPLSGNYPILQPPGSSSVLIWINTGTDVSPVWLPQSVGTLNVDTGKDVLVDYTGQTLTFAVAPPNLTKAIKIQYAFMYSGGQPYPDLVSQSKYGRVLSQRLTASDANSAANMQTLINHLDQQFSQPLEVITLNVSDDMFPNNNRFDVGQYVPFHNQKLNISGNYYIHSITTNLLGGQIRSYGLDLRSYTLI